MTTNTDKPRATVTAATAPADPKTTAAIATHPSNAPATPQSLSVFATSAARWGMDPTAFERAIVEMILPQVKNPGQRVDSQTGLLTPKTKAQVAACLLVSNELKLNPFKREVFFFEDQKGVLRPIMGIDGWGTLANNHMAYDGEDEPIYGKDDGGIYCEIRLHRKDRIRPFVKRCYLDEWKRDTPNWRGAPRHMLWVRTRAHAIRFGLGFSVMDEDDFARMVEYENVRSQQLPASTSQRPRTAEAALRLVTQNTSGASTASDAAPQEQSATDAPQAAPDVSVEREQPRDEPPHEDPQSSSGVLEFDDFPAEAIDNSQRD